MLVPQGGPFLDPLQQAWGSNPPGERCQSMRDCMAAAWTSSAVPLARRQGMMEPELLPVHKGLQ